METEKPEEKEELKIDHWYDRITDSEKVMKREFKPKYDLARKRLRSEYKATLRATNPSHKTVNLVYAIGNSFVNSVMFKNPEINFTARDDAEWEQVENTEVKVNDFLKDKKAKKTAKRIVWDAFLGGFGCRYVDFEYEDYETEEPIMVRSGVDPMTGQPMMIPAVDAQGNPKFKRVITKNQPVFKRVRPDLVRFPKGFDFDNADESPWLGFDLVQPIEEVQNNVGFDEAVRKEIKGSAYESASDKDNKTQKDGQGKDKYTRTHYVFMKPEFPGDTYKLLVLSSEHKTKALKLEEFDKGQIGYPVKFLYFNPLDDDCSYPNGDPWLIESQLQAVDDYFNRLHNHVKRSNPKWVGDKRHIPQETLQQLKSNDDLEWVLTEPKNGVPVDRIFTSLQHPPVHSDNHIFYELNESLLNRIAPKSGLSQGESTKDVKTAKEAGIIAAGETIDIEARVDELREFFIDLALDLAGLFHRNMQGETEVRIEKENGDKLNRQVTKDQMSTNFAKVDVNVDSMQAPNKEVYRRQLLDMLAVLKEIEPAMAKKDKAVDIEFFLPKILSNFGVNNAEKAVIKLNLRNPNKEHEDAVFKAIPLEIQDGEDLAAHAQEHFDLLQDQGRLAQYEALRPGFAGALDIHFKDTAKELQAQQKQTSKPGVSGARDPQATEMSRV